MQGAVGAAGVKVVQHDAAMALGALDAHGHVGTDAARVSLASTMGHREGVGEAVGCTGADVEGVVEALHPLAQTGQKIGEEGGDVGPRDVAEGVRLVPVRHPDGAVGGAPVRQQPAQ